MLSINIKSRELFDERTSEFITVKGGTLKLEHSLVSISKWESKWKIPFLSKEKKTNEQIDDYIRCILMVKEILNLILLHLNAFITG